MVSIKSQTIWLISSVGINKFTLPTYQFSNSIADILYFEALYVICALRVIKRTKAACVSPL